MANDADTLARFRIVVKEQIKCIDELRAENERLKSAIEQSGDAMVVLQTIFTDESIFFEHFQDHSGQEREAGNL